MARKEITDVFKIQAPGGKATPAPAHRPGLGGARRQPRPVHPEVQRDVRHLNGQVVGVLITVYKDRTFDIELKSPPAAELLKAAVKAEKGSGEPNKNKIGKVTMAQCKEMAKLKLKDLNAFDPDHAARIIAGTARSMGITVERLMSF